MYAFLLTVHAAIGGLALLSFWSAGLARKGGTTHRLAGRTFLLAMIGIGATALPMALLRLAAGDVAFGVFMLYLCLITTTACLNAWLAIRWRGDWRRYHGPWHRALAWLNLAAAGALLAYGLQRGAVLLAGFSAVGLYAGVQMLRAAARGEQPRWWLHAHYGGMLGAGVATHIAFLGIGLGRLLPAYAGSAQMLAWFGPLATAVVIGWRLRRRYGAPAQPLA